MEFPLIIIILVGVVIALSFTCIFTSKWFTDHPLVPLEPEFVPLNDPAEYVEEPTEKPTYEACIQYYRELIALATSPPFGVEILLPPGVLCEEYIIPIVATTTINEPHKKKPTTNIEMTPIPKGTDLTEMIAECRQAGGSDVYWTDHSDDEYFGCVKP